MYVYIYIYIYIYTHTHISYVKVKVTQSCLTLCDPGQNTGVGGLFLLQGIFPIQDQT